MTIVFSHAKDFLLRTGDHEVWHLGIELPEVPINRFHIAMYDAAREVELWLKKHKQPMNGTLQFAAAHIDMAKWNFCVRPSPVYRFDFYCKRPEKFDPRFEEKDQP